MYEWNYYGFDPGHSIVKQQCDFFYEHWALDFYLRDQEIQGPYCVERIVYNVNMNFRPDFGLPVAPRRNVAPPDAPDWSRDTDEDAIPISDATLGGDFLPNPNRPRNQDLPGPSR